MTVAEYLQQEGKQLHEVQVIALKWYVSVVDHRKPNCGCLDREVRKVRDDVIYVD